MPCGGGRGSLPSLILGTFLLFLKIFLKANYKVLFCNVSFFMNCTSKLD
jgi:hypothetical protein